MGAVHGAMAGGAAAAASYERYERAIKKALNKEFRDPEDRKNAETVRLLMNERNEGNVVLNTMIPFVLAMPSMFLGMMIFGAIVGDDATMNLWLGILFMAIESLALYLPFWLGMYLERLVIKRPAQQQLDILLGSLDPEKRFEERVKKVISEVREEW